MAKIQRPSKEALISFFRGESAPEESDLIRFYLALNIDRAFVQQCLHEAWKNADWESPKLPTGVDDNETAWQKFRFRKPVDQSWKFNRNFWKYPIAAAMLVISTSIALLFYYGNSTEHKSESAANFISYQKFNAEIGKLTVLTLPDSSRITMFPGANIELPDNFNRTDRKIRLTGKAYFQVKHDVKRPFYVSSGKLTTKVLGTGFEVNTLKDNHKQTVTLVTGKIAVRHGAVHLGVLVPNQKITVSETGKFAISKVNAAQLISWTTEQLRYDQVPLVDICSELEDWYGVRITIRNKTIINRRLTANFKRKSLDMVLDILAMTGRFKYTITNNEVTIY